MPETAQCYSSGNVDWLSVLEILAETAPAIEPLVKAGLRIRMFRGEAQFIVPSPHHGVHRGNKAMATALQALQTAIRVRGKDFDPDAAGANSVNLDAYPHPVAALAVMASGIVVNAGGADAAGTIQTERFAIVFGTDERQLASALGIASWLAPAVRLSVSTEGGASAVLQFSDTGATLAAIEALAVERRIAGFHLLDVYELDAVRFAVERREEFPPRVSLVPSIRSLRAFNTAIQAFRALAPAVSDSAQNTVTTIAVIPGGDSPDVWQFPLPKATAAPLVRDVTPLEITFRQFLPNDEALEHLAHMWGRLPKDGYRLALHPVPTSRNPGSPDLLLDQIRVLERELDFARALQAPQRRLLRFSHAQLPAMIEALRAIPPQTIDRGAITYGFHASTADPLGAHFLSWFDDDVAPTEYFAEQVWRVRTEDRPMRYWIDPAWAHYYASHAGEVKSLVMIPDGQILSPTLHAYRNRDEVDMDAYLQGMIGGWFGGSNETRVNPEEPIYLVSPSRTQGFELSLEILDSKAFQPFRRRVNWVSSVLELLSGIDLEEFVRQGAGLTARQRILENLERDNKRIREALAEDAASLEAELSKRLGGYLDALTREVDTLAGHIERFGRLVEGLTAESEQAERLVAAMIEATVSREERLARVTAETNGLESERKLIGDSLVKAVATTDAFVETARGRLAAAQNQIARLRQELDRARDG